MEELLRGSATRDGARGARARGQPGRAGPGPHRRAEEVDGDINTSCCRASRRRSRRRARPRQALDRRASSGPLHGVPFTAKECIEVAGMPCCDASKIFEGNVSTAGRDRRARTCATRARSCSARPTSPSSRSTTTRTTSSTAPPATRTTPSARSAAPRAARARRSRRASRRSASAPTTAGRSACPRTSTASSG